MLITWFMFQCWKPKRKPKYGYLYATPLRQPRATERTLGLEVQMHTDMLSDDNKGL